MDVSEILEGLNDAQRQAVTSEARALRVIAGAGSGKTRVLVQRMQWLMAVDGISPYGLLALTFTNKAAREMRQRLEQALARPMGQLWMGTFHGICLRILRRHAPRMGWPEQFVVMDSDDQQRMVKRLMRARSWDESMMKPKQMAWQINAYKEEGLRADDVPASSHPMDIAIRDLYKEYEQVCRRQGTMDFSELLLLTVELLSEHEDVRKDYQRRFQSVLVDEFQDTNALQFRLVELFCAGGAKLFVVGDDDQSIYGWRGARVENILSLENDFPKLETIRLEQNYRSTQTILDAANAVIAQNSARLGKTLWSDGESGEQITIYPAINEYDEARYVTEQIQHWVNNGGSFSECAVLYRSNAQSRVFEELFLQNRLPYRVYGGLRFFERAEVKDALAYLRLTMQPADDGALERVINTPTRGIGAKTIAQVRELAREAGSSMWAIIADDAMLSRHFSGRARNALLGFVDLIRRMTESVAQDKSLKRALQIAVQDSGLYAMHEESGKEESETRRDNLDELINAGSYVDASTDPDSDRIMDFLAEAALDAGDGQAEEGSDSVQLMTLHSAKGLEFPNVFMVGVEEGLFPSSRSLEEPQRLEEERRLAYVGMTRAERKLTLCFAERRRFQGQESYPQPSRFIHEIPDKLVISVRPMVFAGITSARYAAPRSETPQGSSAPFSHGDTVRHPKFGEGFVMMLEGSGDHARVLVNFSDAGEKWLVLAYAKLEKC
ncbi:DNA helicase II [Cardiobacteriaceae bacterium TAE3-ERU3]|nr:DNA helicase II [Cardiobacteriaceae bacterium TAE3-ERU3]